MRSALCASLSVAGLALKCALFGVLLQGSPLFADIHYVDLASPDPAPPYTNWANAATTIQEAVDAAADGDTVLVADGIYDTGGVTNYPEGSLLLNRVAIYKPITVRSVNGPTNTLIQGYQDPVWTNGDDAVRCVFMTNGTALIGFTLTNGATRWDAGMDSGGGVWCPSTNAMISNCFFFANAASYCGGGAYSGTLYHCELNGNSSHHGGGAFGSMLYDCLLMDNVAEVFGGGAYGGSLRECALADNTAACGGGTCGADLYDCTLVGNVALQQGGGTLQGALHDCRLIDNHAPEGGGAHDNVLSNCLLTGNSADYGGGAIYGTLYGCIITNNSAQEGGGCYDAGVHSSLLTDNTATNGGGACWGCLEHCTVTRNSARFGGGTYESFLLNAISYYNAATVGSNNYHGGVIYFSCTTPLPDDGWGNTNGSPAFVDAPGNDFRLRPESPCIDKGDTFEELFEARDLDGYPRIINGRADMGAYEFHFNANLKVFLQGAYRINLSAMTAAGASALPHTSPYALHPCNGSTTDTNVTDWVLIQLRPGSNNTPVYTRSAYLRRDGAVLDVDGDTNLFLEVSPLTTNYLVISHRNHLAVMSAQPLVFTNAEMVFDFTTASNRYYGGTSGCVALAPNRWGMIAGDADGDGEILNADAQIRATQDGRSGYCRADFDLSGQVTPLDQTLWASNASRVTSVPKGQTLLLPALTLTPIRRTVPATNAVSLRLDGVAGAACWTLVKSASGGALMAQTASGAVYRAGVTQGTDIVEAWDATGALARATFDVLDAAALAGAGKAIVIAGRKNKDDPLWPTTEHLESFAYNTLLSRGFQKQDVLALSPEPDDDLDGNGVADDLHAESTWTNVATVFTDWAVPPGRLFIYLVDHGGSSSGAGYFRLNEHETVTAAQLDAWLDALQDSYTNDVTVVVDFCQSGSFVDELAYTGAARRIVIAACAANEPTYFVAGGLVSFSQVFFSGILMGLDLADAFLLAQASMWTYQSPLLGGNVDDRYYADTDAQIAAGQNVGPSVPASGYLPQINQVTGPQTLLGESALMLWAYDISTPAPPVMRVWCLIVPPGMTPDPAQPVGDLTELDLVYNPDSDQYEGAYGGFTETGQYTIVYYAEDAAGNVSVPRQGHVVQKGYDERVILVACGETSDANWATVNNLATLAYRTFRQRRIEENALYYLSADTNQDLNGTGETAVNGLPTPANLAFAITNWACTSAWDRPADKLTVYLIGDTTNNLLRLNAAATLNAGTLDGWLDRYQSSNGQVCVVMEFSGAGSFLPSLAASPGQPRVCVAAAKTNQAAWWGPGLASFSQYFLSGVFMGLDIQSSYAAARSAIRRVTGRLRQQAQLDDNGDGVGNKFDGALARQWHIGSAFVTGAEKPMIGTVMPDTMAAGTNALTLWVSGVTAAEVVSNVVCLITAPDYDGTNALPLVTLIWSEANKRYEAAYDGFTGHGTYVCTFQATDSAGEKSSPVQALVATPDAYEPDDTAATAGNFAVGTAQVHNFHTSNDVDWVRFYVPSGAVYEIEAEQLFGNADLRLDVWYHYPNGAWTNIDSVDFAGTGTVTEVSGIDLKTDLGLPAGFYYVQVSLATNAYAGPGSDYELRIFSSQAGEGLIVIAVDALNSSIPPQDAKAVVNGVATQAFGAATSFMTNLPPGTHQLKVPPVPGYLPLWDLSLPGQETNPGSYWFGNPKTIDVADGQYNVAIFQFMPVIRASGTVRDGASGAGVDGARLVFTARSGVLSNAVFDGFPGQASYRTLWTTRADGAFPTNVWLPATDWDLTITRPGYPARFIPAAILSLPRGMETNAGTFTLAPNLTTNGVPEWWLMKFGWSNNLAAAALDDTDGDGQPAWREWVSDTDPTNSLSALRIFALTPATNGIRISWQGGSAATQYLERSRALAGTNLQWTAIFTNKPPTPASTNIPDAAATNPPFFYRIKAER